MDQDQNRDRERRPRPEPHPVARGQQRPRTREELQRNPGEQGNPPRTPRRRNRSLFPNPWVYLLFVFGVSAILAALCWTAANDVLALNKEPLDGGGVITVSEDAKMSTIVNDLKREGLIEYKTVFRVFAFFMGAKDKIAPGTYTLNTDMDYRALINGMSSGSNKRMQVTVVIPEGKTVKQIFEVLEENGVSTVEKLNDMAANHPYAFSFLQDIPLGEPTRLEGFLFPDTYDFYLGENPLYVINRMLVNFDAKVTDQMRTQIQDMGYTVRQMMTIASMIERESGPTERATISSVIYNRLNSNATNGNLGIDATLQYVLDQRGENRMVTQDDYQTLESEYNTYLVKGLPPGPIANPGLDSIYAAMNPEKTNYLYYALETENTHHFSATYEEHLAFLNSKGTGQ